MRKKKKNKSAVEMVALRWKGISKKERSAHAKMMVEAREAKKKNTVTS